MSRQDFRFVRRFAIATAVLIAALAPAAARAAGPPAPVPLSRGWTFQLAGAAPTPVSVPHVMQADPTPASFPGTTGTYRLSFTAPALPAGFAWALRFEQVRRVARVELNGVTLGVHNDPYVPFTLPAPSLKPGQRNDLVVAVDNRKGPEPREGWWNWGGITRPVGLVAQGPVVLTDVALLPHLNCDPQGRCGDAQVLLDGWLTNRSPARTRPTVTVRLTAPRSHAVTRAVIAGPELAPGQTARLRARLHIGGTPETWSPETPVRYQAEIETRDGAGTLSQVDRPKIGLRQAIVRDGHLLLNGRRIELRGASVQEDVPGRGSALTDRDIDDIVRQLRAVHANVTRAHYLLNDRLLERLDAAGILVWTQAPIFHRDVLLRTPVGQADALGTLRDTVLAARNHASTLLYSVANELNATPMRMPPTQAYLLAAARQVRDLDPTHPVGVDVLAYPSLPFDPTYRSFDALGVNSYFGWYPGKPERPTGAIEQTGPYLRQWHDRYPQQALVLTEFGAEATKNGPATEKQTYAFQADYLRRMLKAVAASPADGAIYWTLREFAVKPFWDGLTNGTPRPGVAVDSIHNKGLISYGGAPKPAWKIAARDFASTPLFPGAPSPSAEARRTPPPPPGSDAPGAILAGLAMLALLATATYSLLAFRDLRAGRRVQAEVVPLRRELHGDDVAVGHDVVAAFEA
jgi:beta-glucuronidase